MSNPKVVFAIQDMTAIRCLQPVANYVRQEASVEFLLLDQILETSHTDLPTDQLTPNLNGGKYLNNPLTRWINNIERKQPVPEIIVQRLLEDNLSPSFGYKLDQFIEDTDVDVFVTGHDLLPFVKHVIKRSHHSDFESVCIQHGISRPVLENPSDLPGVPTYLSPTEDPLFASLEKIKRRVGFRYGAFVHCNPYLDAMYTLGDYFTELIGDLRQEYPCFGKTDLVTVGSTEMNPDEIKKYDPSVESAIFLSQWQYENDVWTDRQQSKIVNILLDIENNCDIPITVRPHPQDSEMKIERFFDEFSISDISDLSTDIERHDLVLTVDSTALFEGIINGKVCGVIQPPWDQISFLPFTHDHIIQIPSELPDMERAAHQRSRFTQNKYLKQCCYVPSLDKNSAFDTPVEKVSNDILRRASAVK